MAYIILHKGVIFKCVWFFISICTLAQFSNPFKNNFAVINYETILLNYQLKDLDAKPVVCHWWHCVSLYLKRRLSFPRVRMARTPCCSLRPYLSFSLPSPSTLVFHTILVRTPTLPPLVFAHLPTHPPSPQCLSGSIRGSDITVCILKKISTYPIQALSLVMYNLTSFSFQLSRGQDFHNYKSLAICLERARFTHDFVTKRVHKVINKWINVEHTLG